VSLQLVPAKKFGPVTLGAMDYGLPILMAILGIEVNGAPSSHSMTSKRENNHECDHQVSCL